MSFSSIPGNSVHVVRRVIQDADKISFPWSPYSMGSLSDAVAGRPHDHLHVSPSLERHYVQKETNIFKDLLWVRHCAGLSHHFLDRLHGLLVRARLDPVCIDRDPSSAS